ncbi:MAG: glycosyltransferase [Methanosphaera sp.]|nr:glycosyltransferase [Methanosphaera sp.]
MMVKVSVIIPVYNAGKYLRECLDSITNQTLTDIEIICINDGSTDDSQEILEEYAKKDQRFKLFTQENKGQGATRNRALTYITGEYFSFMDADDTLELETLEKTYNICEEKKLDMVMYKLINYDDTKEEYYNTPLYDMYIVNKTIKNKIFSYKDLGERIFNVSVTPVNKLYNTKFVQDSQVNFPEGIFFEDNIFSWKLMFLAKRIYFLDEYYYIRRVHNDSVIGAGSEKWYDAIEIYNQVWDVFKEFDEFENYKKRLFNNKVVFALYRFDNIQTQFKETFYQKFKEDITNVHQTYNDFIILLTEENLNIVKYLLSSKDYLEFEQMKTITSILKESDNLKNNYKKLEKGYKKQIQNYQNIIYNKQERIKKLEKEKSQINIEKNKINAEKIELLNFKENVINSTSWKITKPLRTMILQMKKLLKK